MTRRQLFKSFLSVPIVAITGKLLPQDAPMATDHVYVYRASNTGEIDDTVLRCAEDMGYRAGCSAKKLINDLANTGISNIWFG